MSKIQPQSARKIWQPLNRQSQILATIAMLAAAAFQVYLWHSGSLHMQPSQPRPAQSHKNQSK